MSTASTNMLQLPVATGLDGTESVWVVQGGTDKRTTTGAIAAIDSGGGTGVDWIIVTDPGVYVVPDSALRIIINKTDGANVVMPAIDDKVGDVIIVGAQATAFPFNLVLTDGTIMGSLSSYPFVNDYQAATFSPVPDLTTYAVI